jgi:hypothetical protein
MRVSEEFSDVSVRGPSPLKFKVNAMTHVRLVINYISNIFPSTSPHSRGCTYLAIDIERIIILGLPS